MGSETYPITRAKKVEPIGLF